MQAVFSRSIRHKQRQYRQFPRWIVSLLLLSGYPVLSFVLIAMQARTFGHYRLAQMKKIYMARFEGHLMA
jgi:hypothetical protein